MKQAQSSPRPLSRGLRAASALVLLALYAPGAPGGLVAELRLLAEEGVELQRSFTARSEFELSSLEIMVNGDEQQIPELEVAIRNRKTLTIVDSYDEVEQGRALRFTRTFEELARNMELENVTQGQSRELEGTSDLEGESVVFVWSAEEEEYEIDEDELELDEEVLAGLEADMDFTAFLPDDEVEVGDTWKVGREAILAIAWPGGDLAFYNVEEGELNEAERERDAVMRDAIEGEGEVTFAETREVDGVRCAVLKLDLQYESAWSGTQSNPMAEFEVTMTVSRSLEGELLWILEAGRLHSAELKATGANERQRTGELPSPGGGTFDQELNEVFEGEIEYSYTVALREE